MKAIVLSGGGSKGSYQIGVWKALKKLHIKYDIVTGTSVGALNGALMTQKSYRKAIKLWKNINLKTLFGEEAIENTSNLKLLKMYKDNFIKNGGMDVENLQNVINKNININKFFKSNINYGLITFNLSKRKPLKLTKKKIPKDKLTDYLMASASCYPAFKKKEIDNKNYIDGGVYDNLPINLALELGADEIISIDLKAPGIKQPPKKKVPTIKIVPNNELTNFLNFNEEGAKRNIKFGYNDTLKVFKKAEGKKYTFKLNSLEKNIKKHNNTWNYTFNKIVNNKKLIATIKKLLKLNDKTTEKITKKILLSIMESLGKDFEIDETRIYSYNNFNKKLIRNLNKNISNKNISKNNKQIISIYKKIAEEKNAILRKEIFIYPNEFLKALYLFTIKED